MVILLVETSFRNFYDKEFKPVNFLVYTGKGLAFTHGINRKMVREKTNKRRHSIQ